MNQRLRRLGFDKRNLRALPLLPLVEVAWADGKIQRRELDLIRKKADEHALRTEDRRMLDNWVRHTPSTAYVRSAHGALAWLAEHGDPSLDPEMLRTMIRDAKRVAQASGGVLGFGAVCKAERDTLSRLASDLVAPPPDDSAGELEIDDSTHPDFARKNGVVTLAWTETMEDEGDAVLSPLFDAPMRLPVTAGGVVVGSSLDATIRIVGDPDVSDRHCFVYSKAGEYFVKAIGGPVWVNGERFDERRLLGGETIRVTPAASFVFKWVRPMAS